MKVKIETDHFGNSLIQRLNTHITESEKKTAAFFSRSLSPWWIIQAVFMLQRIQNEAAKGTVGKREIETIDNDQKGYGMQYP